MNKAEIKALKNVVHYLFEDEKKHYEEMDRQNGHIFESVLALNVFIQEHDKQPKIKVTHLGEDYSTIQIGRLEFEASLGLGEAILNILK